MGKSHSEIVIAFAEGATSGKGSRIFIEGDTIYSYGYHFPLAKRIGTREYLINPESYSSSTRKHQGHVARILVGALWIAPDCKISNIVPYYQSKISVLQDKLLRSRKHTTYLANDLKRTEADYAKACDRFDLKVPPKTIAEAIAEAEMNAKIKRKLLETSLKGGS